VISLSRYSTYNARTVEHNINDNSSIFLDRYLGTPKNLGK